MGLNCSLCNPPPVSQFIYKPKIYIQTNRDFYNVALKMPHGSVYKAFNHDTGEFDTGDDISHWIKTVILYGCHSGRANSDTESWEWVVYNDQPPSETTAGKTPPSNCGYCKGILLWNSISGRVVWLIHSVPRFPVDFHLRYCVASRSTGIGTGAVGQLEVGAVSFRSGAVGGTPGDATVSILPDIPHSELVHGQSFGCFYGKVDSMIDDDNTDDGSRDGVGAGILHLLDHLLMMRPYIYITSSGAQKLLELVETERNKIPSLTSLKIFDWPISRPSEEVRISHWVKPAKYSCDFYKELASSIGNMYVESWVRGQGEISNMNVRNLHGVAIDHFGTGTSTIHGGSDGDAGTQRDVDFRFRESQDHSKWAVSISDIDKWVMIGDFDRMCSQRIRGGGGMVIYDEKLHAAFIQIVVSSCNSP
jgi:hypothetical protein